MVCGVILIAYQIDLTVRLINRIDSIGMVVVGFVSLVDRRSHLAALAVEYECRKFVRCGNPCKLDKVEFG